MFRPVRPGALKLFGEIAALYVLSHDVHTHRFSFRTANGIWILPSTRLLNRPRQNNVEKIRQPRGELFEHGKSLGIRSAVRRTHRSEADAAVT
jgi:hypothetical protein